MQLVASYKGEGVYSLQGQMTLEAVPTAWPELDRLWQGTDKPQVLDLAPVTKVDTSGLAWILSIVKRARQNNCSLKLRNVPVSMIKLAKISDLEGVLPLE